MNIKNRITEICKIKYPIIQGGMVWCSGWKLASAVSNQGGLGLLGAGSMDPEILKHHIQMTKQSTNNPFGVNVPLLKKNCNELIDTVISQKVTIVFTSAGNPELWTKKLKDHGIIVAHVVSNSKFALKAVEAGVDMIVAEGFEAGGHNGREETTTFVLIPLLKKWIDVPVIAAGGIGSGQSVLAALALGAEGVQIGSLFAASLESSAHDDYKNKICEIKEGETRLILKKLIPVRMINNAFCKLISSAESKGAGINELLSMLGSGREKMGIFEGDLENGELEIGQVSASIETIRDVETIFNTLIKEFNEAYKNIGNH